MHLNIGVKKEPDIFCNECFINFVFLWIIDELRQKINVQALQ